MKELQVYIDVVWRKKWWIVAASIVAAAIAFVLTLPVFSPKLYGVRLYVETYTIPYKTPQETVALWKNYLESDSCKKLVLSRFGEIVDATTHFNESNYESRVKVAMRNRDLLFYIKHENTEKACEIANFLADLYNNKMRQLLLPYFKAEKAKKELILQQIQFRLDSLQNEKEQLVEICERCVLGHKAILTLDDYERYSNEICEINAEISVVRDYANVLTKANPQNATIYPKRAEIIFATFLLTLFASILFFVAITMVKNIFKN